jgi:hypothetical protein
MRTTSRWLVALAVAVGTTLAVALPAAASTATIQDDANVLNVTAVQNEAARLPVSIYIWTTTEDATNRSEFDQLVQEKVSSRTPIVLGINTRAHHDALRIGQAAGLSQDAANTAASNANSAFDGVMRSRNDYTGAVQAALTSLKSSLTGARSHGGGSSVLGAVILLIIIVVVIGVLGRVFRGFRRAGRMGGFGFGRRYGRGYGPPPGYGPGYGDGYGYGPGYGPGYGRGGGIGAGIGGAVGGGLLGYELGRMAGENEQFRRDEMAGDGGFGGDGGWVTGQDSDFGGGGGDFGGGDSGGGGDFGGGGDGGW